MLVDSFRVDSPHVEYTAEVIQSTYEYQTTEFVHEQSNGKYEWVARPKSVPYQFATQRKVPKLGYATPSPLLPPPKLHLLSILQSLSLQTPWKQLRFLASFATPKDTPIFPTSLFA
jgi:hypothetical protein